MIRRVWSEDDLTTGMQLTPIGRLLHSMGDESEDGVDMSADDDLAITYGSGHAGSFGFVGGYTERRSSRIYIFQGTALFINRYFRNFTDDLKEEENQHNALANLKARMSRGLFRDDDVTYINEDAGNERTGARPLDFPDLGSYRHIEDRWSFATNPESNISANVMNNISEAQYINRVTVHEYVHALINLGILNYDRVIEILSPYVESGVLSQRDLDLLTPFNSPEDLDINNQTEYVAELFEQVTISEFDNLQITK